MDIKDFILIGGGILIALVVGHGFWIAWRAKREPLRLDIVPDLIPDDVDEIERLRGELPNGGARIRRRPDTPPEKKLHDFVTLLLKRLVAMQAEPWPVRLLMREVLQPTEACQQLVRDYFRPFFEVMLGVLDELVGERLDDSVRYKIGFSIVGQCLHYRVAGEFVAILIAAHEREKHFRIAQLADQLLLVEAPVIADLQ